jgi:uncharacterized membrane protein YeaQ/YmgE (transglycosylase-associated protein family)
MTDAAAASVVVRVRSDRSAELKACAVLIGVLAVLGAALGIVWEVWSPPGPAGAVLEHGIQADESEAFIGGDGRFALITVVVGLIAGVVAWRARPFKQARGPYLAIALALGGVVGAALTEWVGNALRGAGNTLACASATRTCIDHLPLSVHMHALLLTEAVAALLVYSLFVAFAVADDLGRSDPGRVSPSRAPADRPQLPAPVGSIGSGPPTEPIAPVPRSAGAEHDAQQGWGDRDGAGPA